MNINFLNSNLRRLCEDEKHASRKLGSASAKKLRTRLRILQVASKLGEIPIGRPHPLKGKRVGQFAVDLAGGHRLVFEPFDDPLPRNVDGSVKWKELESICIVFIGDYHD